MEQNKKLPVLQVKEISRRFGKTLALDALSFEVEGGQIVGLLGRNGAGKSTLLRIISGQLKAGGGEALLFGKPAGTVDGLAELCLIGDSPDFGNLKNIGEFISVCAGLFPAWNNTYALQLVDRFELPMKKKLKAFSRGMQTSLLLIAGLASGARLTVFDEPSLGLDAVMRERFYDQLVESRQRGDGRTYVLSTHLIDEVARTLDCAVLIDRGRLLAEGTLAELTRQYFSISGAPDAVREASAGAKVLKEEEVAGSLVRHFKLQDASQAEALEQGGRVQFARMNLQRLFVFLTEENERHPRNGAAEEGKEESGHE